MDQHFFFGCKSVTLLDPLHLTVVLLTAGGVDSNGVSALLTFSGNSVDSPEHFSMAFVADACFLWMQELSAPLDLLMLSMAGAIGSTGLMLQCILLADVDATLLIMIDFFLLAGDRL